MSRLFALAVCGKRNFLITLAAALLATLSHASPPPLSAYGALPAAEDPTLSPSGKRVAVIVTLEGKRRVMVQEINGPTLLYTDLGDLKLRYLDWAGENFVVLTTSATENLGMEYGFLHELHHMLVLDIARRRVLWLPDLKNNRVLNAVFGRYHYRQLDGHWFAYGGAMPLSSDQVSGNVWLTNSGLQLSRFELDSGKMHLVSGAAQGNARWLLDAQGEVLASDHYDEGAKRWRLYAGAHRERMLAEEEDAYRSSYLIGHGRTPDTVAYSITDRQGGTHYMEVPLAGGEAKEMLKDWVVDRWIEDPVTHLLAGALRDGEAPELILFDPVREARVRGTRKAFPNYWVRFHSWSDDFKRFIVLTEGADDSGTWWYVDVDKGEAKEIAWRYPGVKSGDVGTYRVVKYKAADGLDLEGILTLPPGVKPERLPLVVLAHGGPAARDYPRFDWWAQAFASRGYAVWQPNYRGSSGYGLEFENAGHGEWGRKMQTDISDGVAELARAGIVDPQRACIVGGSYGGYAALAGVTVQQGLYRCAVSMAGVADLKVMLLESFFNDPRSELRYWQDYLNVRSHRDETLAAISPAKLAGRADAPVLLIHGKDDTVVPFNQSVLMQKALLGASKPVELVALEGEDHYLSRGKTRTAMLEAAVAFVMKHNPP